MKRLVSRTRRLFFSLHPFSLFFLYLFQGSSLLVFLLNLLLSALLIFPNSLQLGLIWLRIRLSLINKLHLSRLLNGFLFLGLLATHLLACLLLELLLLLLQFFLLKALVSGRQSHTIQSLLLIRLPQRLNQDLLKPHMQLEIILHQVPQLDHAQILHEVEHLVQGVFPTGHLAEPHIEDA